MDCSRVRRENEKLKKTSLECDWPFPMKTGLILNDRDMKAIGFRNAKTKSSVSIKYYQPC